MIGLDLDLNDILRSNSTLLLFLPAIIFGYLFHLIGDLVFLWWGGGWVILVALLFGAEKSIHFPIPKSDVSLPSWYNTEHAIWWIILISYAVYVGPAALFAALNNLLPEHREIHLTKEPLWHLTELPHGAIATNDLLVVALLGIHLVSYVVIVGPTILFFLIGWIWMGLKILGRILNWVIVRL